MIIFSLKILCNTVFIEETHTVGIIYLPISPDCLKLRQLHSKYLCVSSENLEFSSGSGSDSVSVCSTTPKNNGPSLESFKYQRNGLLNTIFSPDKAASPLGVVVIASRKSSLSVVALLSRFVSPPPEIGPTLDSSPFWDDFNLSLNMEGFG